MANKSNNGNRGKKAIIPMMGNKNKGSFQQPINNRQVFDKRVKDNARVKH